MVAAGRGECFMDKAQENELVQFILQYMLDHYFRSKADMARRLGLSCRTVQRAFERLQDDTAKGSSIVLNRVLLYCACQQLSLDCMFEDYIHARPSERVHISDDKDAEVPAYRLLSLSKPTGLTDSGEQAYRYVRSFLQKASTYLCPRCTTWCNPWCHQQWISEPCLMAHMANTMINALRIYHRDTSSVPPELDVQLPSCNFPYG